MLLIYFHPSIICILFFLETLHSPKEVVRTVDLIELAISTNNYHSDLSLLRLPTVFQSLASESSKSSTDSTDHSAKTTSPETNLMTVSKFVSTLSESSIIDYMFNCELRYSKNVLPIMRYLFPKLCQPCLIYELDFELTSFFRYIRWKMLNFYMKHTGRVRRLVQRMFGIINLGVSIRGN